MSNDPITLRVDDVDRGSVRSRVRVLQYVPSRPGGDESDPLAASDLALAQRVAHYLETRFPIEYGWKVYVDQAQGMILIWIPRLMGETGLKFFINLHTTPIDQGVLRAAGELLERYNLSRTRFNSGEFLDARAKHSALVNRWRPIPS